MTDHQPFQIDIDDDAITDLQNRLDRTRFPQQIDGIGWDMGTELETLRSLCDHWRHDFDWRAAEALLNEWPQFVTEIDGERLHYAHIRSVEADAMPLVITHGWPGSISEFLDIVGPLTDPASHGGRSEDAFHVVLPSIPGFGFSGPTSSRGNSPQRIAGMISNLMAQLGYDRYLAQGGDWGAIITSHMGRIDAEHLAGIHVNMPVVPPQPSDDPTPAELEALEAESYYRNVDSGYGTIQGTKPQTIGYSLNDSPAGLAAWIVEKFRQWSDCDGDVFSSFTPDQLLTNISIYWFTQTAHSSARIYFEQRNTARPTDRIEVPTAVARFPKEIFLPPRTWCEAGYNISRWTDFGRGGHFAAMEVPHLLVGDIRAFAASLRST
ncbi:MAG: epoxide hydrolase [Actinomycetota bacterium]|jgi:epoxide hydrolase|nr:epoxide hydrolase [Actinomycetota bacterium]